VEAAPVGGEQRVWIGTDRDIVAARQEGRARALEVGFSQGDATVISAAISEIARNMLDYARGGEICITPVESGERRGIEVIGRDSGPGIPDISLALLDGYSTSGNLGLGLPGSRRLMDDFEVKSDPGVGTTVTMRKWTR
jgi:serine/threonine-protein kinase RsbT